MLGILRVLGLGDSIVFSPILKQLIENIDDEVDLFAGGGLSKDYFSRFGGINVISLKYNKTSFIDKIKIIKNNYKKYDLMVDTFQGSRLTNIISRVFGKKSLGFSCYGSYDINIDYEQSLSNKFIINKDLLILKKLNIGGNFSYELKFQLFDSDYDSLKLKVGYIPKNFMVLHPSSNFTYHSRKLSLEQIEKIIDYILQKGCEIFVIGSDDDEVIINRIKKRKGLHKVHDKKLTIRETGKLIDLSRCFLGINSGPMRISVALKKNTIVLNGPTAQQWIPPESYYPWVKNIYGESVLCDTPMCDKKCCIYNKKGPGLCMMSLPFSEIRRNIDLFLS